MRRATHRSSKATVAVKLLPLPAELRASGAEDSALPSDVDLPDVEDLLKEVAILRRLRNKPHLLQLREYFICACRREQ